VSFCADFLCLILANLWCFSFSEYVRITTVEQRRKYKTEFDTFYAEYRQLHEIMEKTRRRFAYLQEELSKVHQNERKYKVSIAWLCAAEHSTKPLDVSRRSKIKSFRSIKRTTTTSRSRKESNGECFVDTKHVIAQRALLLLFHSTFRFDYLHEKLSHIKKLVSDFDSQLTKGGAAAATNGDSQPLHATY